MYGVTLISRDRATVLLHWLHDPEFLPSWDTAALQTVKLGNVVVWEMHTEKQGEHGVSARILVEPTCTWVLQVWPSEGASSENWAPFTSVAVDPKLLPSTAVQPSNELGALLRTCLKEYAGKAVRIQLDSPALKVGSGNLVYILVHDVQQESWVSVDQFHLTATQSAPIATPYNAAASTSLEYSERWQAARRGL